MGSLNAGHFYACIVVHCGWHTAQLSHAQFHSFPAEESGIRSRFLCECLDRQYYLWLGLHQHGTVMACIGVRGFGNLDSSCGQPWLLPNRHRESAWVAARSRGLHCPVGIYDPLCGVAVADLCSIVYSRVNLSFYNLLFAHFYLCLMENVDSTDASASSPVTAS